MKKKNTTHIRIRPEDKIKLDEMRFKLAEIEKKPIPREEVLRRTFNIPRLRGVLEEDSIQKKELRKIGLNRRGLVGPLISVFVIILAVMMVIVGFWIFGLAMPPIVDSVGTVTTVMQNASAGNSAMENATETTFVNVNKGMGAFHWIGYSMFIASLLGFVFVAFYVRTYPFLLIFWVGFMVVLIIGSIGLASAYQDIAGSVSYYEAWQTQHFFLTYQPHILVAMAFLGGLVLFVLISKESEAEAVL